MAFNTTSSLNSLICNKFVDFGKWKDSFGQFSWSKNDSNYLDVKLELFKMYDNRDLHLVLNFTMGDSIVNQFMRLRSQLALEAENFGREKNSSTVVITTMSKDLEEHFKLTHKVIDVMDQKKRGDLCYSAAVQCGKAKEFICSSSKVCNEEGRDSSRIVYVNYKLDEFIFLLDVMNSVYDKVITIKPLCIVT